MKLGIDFGGTNIKVGVYDDDASEISFEEHSLQNISEKNGIEQGLFNIIKSTFKKYKISSGGLAIKGLVNRKDGTLINDVGAASIFANTNLKKLLENEFKVPFTIENDARAYAYGEYMFGAGKGYNSIVLMTLGTGLGCAAVINNKLYSSSDPLSGILGGHISIDKNGPECVCGNKGCLELYCSASALKRIIKENHQEYQKINDPVPLFFNVVLDNNDYIKTFRDFQENLAIGIVNIIHAYGPEVVILGGGVMKSAGLIIPRVQKIVDKRAWTYPRGKVKILSSKLGNRAASIGVVFLESNMNINK